MAVVLRAREGGPFATAAFRWYFAGTTVSLAGSTMASVALAFAVLAFTSDPADLGLVLAARSAPLVLFLLVGGAVADRFPRRAVLLAANLGAAVTQGVVAVLLLTGRFDLGWIMGLEFLNGAISAFTSPASRGIVTEVTSPERRQRANALLGTARNAIRVLGPSTAGVLVVTVGGGWAVAADALSFLLAAGCTARLRLPARPAATGARSAFLTDLREGWTTVRATGWLWTCIGAATLTNLIQVGVWGVLGPEIAHQTIGAAAWGVVLSARAAGLLAMSAVMYRLRVQRLLAFGQLGILAGAVPLLALGLGAGPYVLAAAAFVWGLGSGVMGVAFETSLQEHVPPDRFSRVASYDDFGSFAGVPAGQALAGPLASAVGPSRTAVAGALLYALAAALPLASRSLRTLRHSPSPPGS